MLLTSTQSDDVLPVDMQGISLHTPCDRPLSILEIRSYTLVKAQMNMHNEIIIID